MSFLLITIGAKMNDANLIKNALTPDDIRLIEMLCEERSSLRRQMLELSNESIAEKFEIPIEEVKRISYYMTKRRYRK